MYSNNTVTNSLLYNHTYTSYEMFQFCKHHHAKSVRNLLNFLSQHPRVIPSHQDKSHDFQTSFAIFRILKSFGHTFVGAFSGQDVKKFFLFHV